MFLKQSQPSNRLPNGPTIQDPIMEPNQPNFSELNYNNNRKNNIMYMNKINYKNKNTNSDNNLSNKYIQNIQFNPNMHFDNSPNSNRNNNNGNLNNGNFKNNNFAMSQNQPNMNPNIMLLNNQNPQMQMGSEIINNQNIMKFNSNQTNIPQYIGIPNTNRKNSYNNPMEHNIQMNMDQMNMMSYYNSNFLQQQFINQNNYLNMGSPVNMNNNNNNNMIGNNIPNQIMYK
jgi:hypothetical protein